MLNVYSTSSCKIFLENIKIWSKIPQKTFLGLASNLIFVNYSFTGYSTACAVNRNLILTIIFKKVNIFEKAQHSIQMFFHSNLHSIIFYKISQLFFNLNTTSIFYNKLSSDLDLQNNSIMLTKKYCLTQNTQKFEVAVLSFFQNIFSKSREEIFHGSLVSGLAKIWICIDRLVWKVKSGPDLALVSLLWKKLKCRFGSLVWSRSGAD